MGAAHIGVFRLISQLQIEQNRVELDIEASVRGAPRPPQKRKVIDRENRIRRVFNDRDNYAIEDFLRGYRSQYYPLVNIILSLLLQTVYQYYYILNTFLLRNLIILYGYYIPINSC